MNEKKVKSVKKKVVKETVEKTEETKSQRLITATVTSDKMNKTIVVQVMRMVKHPLYGKYLRHYSKMYVHDEKNECRNGDVVKIKQTRPISKTKRWALVEVVRRADHTLADSGLELDESSAA